MKLHEEFWGYAEAGLKRLQEDDFREHGDCSLDRARLRTFELTLASGHLAECECTSAAPCEFYSTWLAFDWETLADHSTSAIPSYPSNSLTS